MKLSFVIPAHNEENYIRRNLESIIKEAKKSERDIEIIVVNNASDDRTREIVLEFQDVILVDEPRKGLPQARQAGFLVSSGHLIANMDADSLLPPGWIEKIYEHFSRDEKLVALSGPYHYYDLSKLANNLVVFYYSLGYIIHLINHKILKKSAMLQGGNFVLRRSALEKIGGFNVDIKFYGEDTDIAMRIQKVGKVEFDFGFKMHTSARRLKEEGFVKTAGRYVINFFWVSFFKKPLVNKEQVAVSRISNNAKK
jgi:glycosyltransferase involved in cell wall biosynthesis